MHDPNLEWLGAYMDGELHGKQLAQLEAHLQDCLVCQAELESLQNLHSLLQTAPLPEALPSPEQFSQRVGSKLSPRSTPTRNTDILGYGWLLVPIAIISTWFFIQAFFLLGNWLIVADWMGLMGEGNYWLLPSIPGYSLVALSLSQLSLLSGMELLNWFGLIEQASRSWLWQVTLLGSLALMYLSWLTLWLLRSSPARRMKMVNGYA